MTTGSEQKAGWRVFITAVIGVLAVAVPLVLVLQQNRDKNVTNTDGGITDSFASRVAQLESRLAGIEQRLSQMETHVSATGYEASSDRRTCRTAEQPPFDESDSASLQRQADTGTPHYRSDAETGVNFAVRYLAERLRERGIGDDAADEAAGLIFPILKQFKSLKDNAPAGEDSRDRLTALREQARALLAERFAANLVETMMRLFDE
ncbi:MAG: hypothetical protein RDV41_14135 [Planctomycetota bacterium]|nr:hypothetical protein [Planctomycetota bacterium]